MFHYSKLFFCYLFFAIASISHADVIIKPETNNHPGPYRPMSDEIQQVNPELLFDLDTAAYANMSPENPLLKLAYWEVFTRPVGNFLHLDPPQALALADMRRRGESVTPMLLKLASENQETGFEIRLLSMVDQVGTVTLDPYLEYARNLLKERTQTMSATSAAAASSLLAKHGSKADIVLLKRVLDERPYVADDVSRALNVFQDRLNLPKQESRQALKEGAPSSNATFDRAKSSTQRLSNPKSSWESISMPWITWGMLIASVICIFCIFWILRKKRFNRD